MDFQSNATLDSCSDESAELALKYSRVLGHMPQTFGVAIRGLMSDYANGGGLSEGTLFQLRRLIKAPTLLASLYFGSKTFFPHLFRADAQKTPSDLIALYDPFCLAAVLSNIYLYKRCKRVCNKEEWRFIAEPLQRNLEIGVRLGSEYKPVGMGPGLMTSFVFYAFASFLAHDTPGFVDYRRHLKRNELDFDPHYELCHWGCTSVQIASNLLISLGFGVSAATSYFQGTSCDVKSIAAIPGPSQPFALIRRWLSSVHIKVGSGRMPGNEFGSMAAEQRSALLQDISETLENGSKYRWLERTKLDVNSLDMPDLIIPPDMLEDVRDAGMEDAGPEGEPVEAAH
ncbi:MAG: hypothetical protein J5J00_05560 [Deltaproteobacteria bacterium]|nr:hypothetical protein [Deltaproteobacteria bacterium]